MEDKRKRKKVIVGHVPLTLSRLFHLFLKHGGQISVKVTGKRRNKGIGLEIPATYTFGHKKESKILKLSELLNDIRRIKGHRRLKAVDRNVTDYCTRLP